MTNANDLASMGDAVDQQIASITHQAPKNVHEQEGATLGASWDAALAAAAPPAYQAVKFGSSAGPSIIGTVALLNPHHVRTYQPGQLAAAIKATPPDTTFHHSRAIDVAAMAGGSTAEMNTTVANARAVPDREDCIFTIEHEAENPAKHNVPAQVKKAWALFLTKGMPVVNAGRTHPLRTAVVLESQSLADGVQENWMVDGTDYVGFDTYVIGRLKMAADYVYSKGRVLIVPEWGWAVSGSFDATKAMVHVQADLAAIKAMPHPMHRINWFNANSNALTPGAPVTALLRSLCQVGLT